MGYWGRGRVWARLARGKRARLRHPTCSAEKRCGFPRLGKKGLNPDASRKHLWALSEGEEAQNRGAADTPLHTRMLSIFPGAAALAPQLLPPFSHQHKWPHPSWHQREPAGEGPHLRGRMGSRSSHGCGLGAGWAGLGPRGQYLCERARAAGKGAAWLAWLLSAGRSNRC